MTPNPLKSPGFSLPRIVAKVERNLALPGRQRVRSHIRVSRLGAKLSLDMVWPQG
jgi:hypothetical protein